MRNWKAVALVALLPAVARSASTEPPPEGTINLNQAAEKLEVGEESRTEPMEAPKEAGPAPALPDTYTVRQGDTLWDLSGKFMGQPWYWPKVWSYNPQIENPHWIYPGNQIRFFASGEESPLRVEPIESPRELDDLTRSDQTPIEQDTDTVAVVGPYKIGNVVARGFLSRRESFVTQRELDESGLINAAFEEKILLAEHDRAYARFRIRTPVKLGQTYVIYKTERKVVHPVSGHLYGYMTLILGLAKVVAVDERAATILISASYDAIERGALLGPWNERLTHRTMRRPNQKALDGYIIATPVETVSQVGEHHMVFIDRGQQDGVQEGNVFSVIRSGDPYQLRLNEPYLDPGYPKEDMGTLLVVDTREHASTALVIRSLRELFVGDRVEMRPASGRAGSGGD